MARTLQESAVTTRNARLKLTAGVHWRGIAEGIHLGYRRAKRGGRWLVRWRAGPGYSQISLAAADDVLDADGLATFNYSQAFAAAVAHVERARARAKAESDGPLPTVRSAITAYVANREKREHDTGDARSRLSRYVLSHPIADTALHELRASELNAWQERHAASLAAASVRRLANDFRAALNDAAKRHRSVLPAELIVAIKDGLSALQRATPKAREAQVLTDDEVREVILAASRVDKKGEWGGDLARMVMTLAATGARFGQVARMTVDDFQPSRSRVLVPIARKGTGEKSIRRVAVPVGPDVLETMWSAVTGRHGSEPLLERWRHVQIAVGKWKRDRRGAWTSASELTRPWRQIIQTTGLSLNVTPYALRHSSIVRGLRTGLPIRLVAALHDTSSAMIEAHYSAFIVDALEELASRAIVPLAPIAERSTAKRNSR